jgi:hypothetical protein
MSTFVEYATEVLSPPRLRGPWGTKWVTAFAAEYDWLKKRLTQGVLARYPRFCPADGLALIGWERQIQRAPGESNESYATRLGAAWETWEWSGTGPGILAGIASCGIATPTWGAGPEWPDGWETGDGYVWLLPLRCFLTPPSGSSSDFARFWVVVDHYALLGAPHVRGEAGFVRGPWGARGTLLAPGQWQAMKKAIRKWRGAGETCIEAVFCVTDNGVGDLRAPLWRRGDGTMRGGVRTGGRVTRCAVGEEGYRA